MTDVSWAKAVDGAFGDAANWTGGVAPGAKDDAILDATGADFTVTSAGAETVESLQMAANASLDVTAGEFRMRGGSGSGVDAGVISIATGAEVTNDGVLTAAGTIYLNGKIDNVGTIDFNGNEEVQPQNSNIVVGSMGAILTGGGTLALSDSFMESFGPARLINVDDTIVNNAATRYGCDVGVGNLEIINESKGTIEATGYAGLVLLADTINDGLIESTGITGKGEGLFIASGEGGGTVSNRNGTILGDGSTVLLQGAVIIGGKLATTDHGKIFVFDAELDGRASPVVSTSAIVVDYGGVLNLTGTIDDLGQIRCDSGKGIVLSDGVFTIGAGRKDAVVAGMVSVSGAGTVINYGSILSMAFGSVDLTSSLDVLKAEPGSLFDGTATGGGGTLDLDWSQGTLVSLSGEEIWFGGEPWTNDFNDFGAVQIGDGDSFTLSGNGLITAGGLASLDILGSLTVDGSLQVAGTIEGSGVLFLAGGDATFMPGASLKVAQVSESGSTAMASFKAPVLTIADTWSQIAGVISAGSGDKAVFDGTADTFDGTLSGAGIVEFTGGTDLLAGTSIAAATHVYGSAAVTLSGTIDLTSTMTVISPGLVVDSGGATLSGGGLISLSNPATSVIEGVSTSATLTNGDTIKGAGQLGDGQMALINSAEGVIHANETTALIIDLGANTLSNAGLIVNTSTGGLTIDGALSSTGTLLVTDGTLTVDGKVIGAGSVKISGGTADFAAAFTQNVTFTSAGGVLELAAATRYGGDITGFSKTGASALDLTDIGSAGATVSYSGATASGVLTVMSGSEVAMIKLEGNYTASTFSLASDGHGGTLVTAAAAAANASAITPLVSAMAAFGTAGHAGATPSLAASPPPLASLAAPTSMGA